MNEELLSYEEAARALGITIGSLKYLVSQRKIGFVKLGHRTIRFTNEQLKSIIEDRKVNPQTEL